MNDSGKVWLMAFVMGIVLPCLLFTVSEKFITREESAKQPQGTVAATEHTQKPTTQQSSVQVAVLTSNGQVMLNMQDYLVGVLLAEMPVDFDEEALKAQAVVSRTYALRRNKYFDCDSPSR